MGGNSAFVVMNASQHIAQQSPYHTTYIGRCKDFVDFQIGLFIKTDLFELIYIDCNWTREYQIQDDSDDDDEVDFVYTDVYLSDSDNMFDSSDDKNVELVKGQAFSSSICFTQMRSLDRFCACCQEVFLMYFISKLHHFSNDVFSFS